MQRDEMDRRPDAPRRQLPDHLVARHGRLLVLHAYDEEMPGLPAFFAERRQDEELLVFEFPK